MSDAGVMGSVELPRRSSRPDFIEALAEIQAAERWFVTARKKSGLTLFQRPVIPITPASDICTNSPSTKTLGVMTFQSRRRDRCRHFGDRRSGMPAPWRLPRFGPGHGAERRKR